MARDSGRRRILQGLYRLYLRLCPTPVSPSFLIFSPLYPRLIRLLRQRAKGLVLDVGSGVSPFYRVVTRQQAHYVSVDYPASSELTPFALPPADGRRHIWADARTLPVRDGACDVAICTSVLEHVTDPGGVLAEIFRVMRPGGIVIGSVPFGLNLHMEPFDYYRISVHGLRHLGETTGFEVERIEPVGRGLQALGACAADGLMRSMIGLRTNTVTGMSALELCLRAALLPLVYPLILLINLLAPVLDRLLPYTSLPVHYIFVYRKR